MNKLANDDETKSCSVEHHQCQADLNLTKDKIHFTIKLFTPHQKGPCDSVQRNECYNCVKKNSSPTWQSSQETFENEDVTEKTSLSPQVTPTSRWSNQRNFRLTARKRKLVFSEMTPPSQCTNINNSPSRKLPTEVPRKRHKNPVALKCTRMRKINDVAKETGPFAVKKQLRV